MQLDEPDEENMPSGHVAHAVAAIEPVFALAVPTGQAVSVATGTAAEQSTGA